MRYTIEQASDIGGVIRAARKAQNMRQDDAAGSVGVSESFMVKVERGAESIQWGKLFQILQGLGVRVTLDIPDATDALVQRSPKSSVQKPLSFVRPSGTSFSTHILLKCSTKKGGVRGPAKRLKDVRWECMGWEWRMLLRILSR